MNLTKEQLIQILVATNIIDEARLDELINIAKKGNQKIENVLVSEGIIDANTLSQKYAETIGVPFIDLTRVSVRKDLLFQIPERIAKSNNVVIFDENDEGIKIAMVDPEDLQTIEFIKKQIPGKRLQIYLATSKGMLSVLKQYKKGLQAEFNEIIDQSLAATKTSEKDLKKMAANLPIVRIVDTLLEHAVLQNASDIHIEPLEKKAIVRYRIDGVLHDVIVLPKEIMPGIVARIKIIANLKIDEHRLPQDGRFKIEKEGYKFSFRVSILPVFDGEKIVMRLLSETTEVLTLEQLGLQHAALKKVKLNIQKPYGMVLITGPTGSGKTTTLYAIMGILNTPEVNISTIEDPVEYRMPRISQSQVKPKIGFTFANGLRALLRQDPDIIMVGEIRDSETAGMAINSALTGHLVLSTLHTNDASSAPTRLIDMGAKPFLVTSTLNVVIAQRLVRKICTNCMEKYKLDQTMIKVLDREFGIDHLMEALTKSKIMTKPKPIEEIEFSRGKGCDQCNQEGFKGRIGIYEVFETSPKINELVLADAETSKISKQAQDEGMLTMAQDGFVKAVTGITTIDEILKVTKD
ncbi:MAG: ATPase, T2SS/T4P/T4SS family [Patescibacteria group bacterium]|nr:ATPase, T2SS/T4P/T4SS family [Patescibacteria group bacterium]